MEPIRVLFISYDGLTDPLGQSQVLPYLVKLSELNYKITVVSTEKEKNFLKNRVTIDSICKNAGIDWEFIFYTKNPPIFSTIRDVSNLKKKVNELYKRSEFQIVHCRSYIAALTGMYIKRKFKTKFLFDMRGFWADERVDGGIWNLNNPVFKLVYNFFKTKEKAYFLSADAAVSLTYNGKKEIVSWDYMRHAKYEISVIPCCADLNYFNYREIDENISVKYELGISLDNKVICYLGSTGTWYMIDEMLDYFTETDNFFNKFWWQIIGFAPHPNGEANLQFEESATIVNANVGIRESLMVVNGGTNKISWISNYSGANNFCLLMN